MRRSRPEPSPAALAEDDLQPSRSRTRRVALLHINSAIHVSSGRRSARRNSMHGPAGAAHPSSAAGSVREELKTSRSPSRRYSPRRSKRVCATACVPRSMTIRRTRSRPSPRRSGGSFAESSSGSVNVNGAV